MQPGSPLRLGRKAAVAKMAATATSPTTLRRRSTPTAASQTRRAPSPATTAAIVANQRLGSYGTELPPQIAAQYDVSSNGLTHPTQLGVNSTRKATWRCAKCDAEFQCRVKDHCATGGACPKCGYVPPPAAAGASPKAPRPTPKEAREKFDASPVHRRDGRVLNPILAYPWAKYAARIDDEDDLFVSPKLDGIRCVAAYDPVLKRPFFVSRHGATFESCDHIAEAITPIMERDPAIVFDAELYNHEFRDDFGSIMSAVKVQRANRTAEHERLQSKIQLHVFDALYAKHVTAATPFTQRLDVIERALGALDSQKDAPVRLVDHTLTTKPHVYDVFEKALTDGYEGVMVRVGDCRYEYGKRTSSMLKLKEMDDDEFRVVGVVEGNGQYAGCVGALVCESLPRKGRKPVTVQVGFSVSKAQRQRAWTEKHKLIGALVTVQYQQLTKDGVPRFPVFKCIRAGPGQGKKDFV